MGIVCPIESARGGVCWNLKYKLVDGTQVEYLESLEQIKGIINSLGRVQLFKSLGII